MEDLASLMDKVEFRQQMRGYNVDDVDRFLDNLATRIRSGQPVSPVDLDAGGFRSALKGYNTADVDAFISDVSMRLFLR